MKERYSPNKGGAFKRVKKNLRIKGQQLLMDRLKKRYEPAFSAIESYCFFYGFPRSSHSLIGALLDAHPDALVAHEQDAFRYINHGFSQEQLFTLLIRNAERKASKGRVQTSYHYHLPDQYQGDWETLRVIGDKKGANTSRWLRANPELLEQLRKTVKVPLKAVNVIRNPFDNIATMAKRTVKWDLNKVDASVLEKAKNEYLFLNQGVVQMENQLISGEKLHLRSEELVAHPRETMTTLLNFLQLAPTDRFLAACEAKIFKKPRKPRWDVSWPYQLIEEVEELIENYPWFEGYNFKV
jgi:hypothetical protein